MSLFERILFPVDFSLQSSAAAPFVKAMADRFRSEVILLHVVEVPQAWYGTPEAGAYDALIDISSMLEDRREALGAYFANGEAGGLSIQRCVQSGDAAAHITQYARQKRVGLIMMPTHGYGPFRSLLLGSVTAKVLHDTECPVWTTAHASEIATDAAKPWHQVICAVDDDSRDVALVRWAAELASSQGAELRLVHAVTGFEEEPSESGNDPLREFLFGVARERIEKMQAEAGTKLEVCLASGVPGKVVRDFATQHAADLVLVGRGKIQKHFGRLRSNAYAIVRDAPCPVISV
jgi:nucleotide-binding universal stress UspA family protein